MGVGSALPCYRSREQQRSTLTDTRCRARRCTAAMEHGPRRPCGATHPGAAGGCRVARRDPPVAEATRDRIHRQLDEITRIAAPETWLPAWTVDDTQTYIDAAKWRHARPNQPPHEYTIRDWRPDKRHDFLAFAQLIQSRGGTQDVG